MIRITSPDLYAAWIDVNNRMWYNLEDCLDSRAGIRAISYDNVIDVENVVNAVDLSLVNYRIGRWTRICREYVDLDAIDEMLVDAKRYLGRGLIPTDLFAGFKDAYHPRGNCLLGLSLAGGGRVRPRIVIYSRASESVQTFALDTCLFRVLVKYIGEGLDLDPDDFRLTWYVSSFSFNALISVCWLFHSDAYKSLLETPLEDYLPIWKPARRCLKQYAFTPPEEIEQWAYKRSKRYARWTQRYINKQYDLLPPSVDPETLTFDCIKREEAGR